MMIVFSRLKAGVYYIIEILHGVCRFTLFLGEELCVYPEKANMPFWLS